MKKLLFISTLIVLQICSSIVCKAQSIAAAQTVAAGNIVKSGNLSCTYAIGFSGYLSGIRNISKSDKTIPTDNIVADTDIKISVFPNPFYNIVKISFPFSGDYTPELSVIGINGKVFFPDHSFYRSGDFGYFEISADNLSQGNYIFKISYQEKKVYFVKAVKL